ncbi:NAD(P)-dependent oxidoreductase [Nocardia salmonicida]|uniref:NAD(P)-dependent oxidoreductase n=1 Tax=Nocardia salmonicida TaxID=53431 RepID=UPI0037964CBF
MTRVGFIGLGSQGAPMARRIAEAGYETTLWARREATLEPFADSGTRVADSPAALAEASDVVCLCVVGDADVREVVSGEHGVLAGLTSGGIVVVHSTVHPDTCRELAEYAAGQGCSLIDAPVSGGGKAAAEGQLLVMVGGPAEATARCRPVFETYANPVVHLGEVGSGQVAKLLNNLLFTANLAVAKSAMDLGCGLGIEPARLSEVVSRGSADSYALGRVALLGNSLDLLAAHGGELLRKDVGLVVEVADAIGASPGIVLAAADVALHMMDHPR